MFILTTLIERKVVTAVLKSWRVWWSPGSHGLSSVSAIQFSGEDPLPLKYEEPLFLLVLSSQWNVTHKNNAKCRWSLDKPSIPHGGVCQLSWLLPTGTRGDCRGGTGAVSILSPYSRGTRHTVRTSNFESKWICKYVIRFITVICVLPHHRRGRQGGLKSSQKSHQNRGQWAKLQRGKYPRAVRSSASVSCAASSVGASEEWWTTCTETTGTTSHWSVTSVMRGQPSWRLCTDTSDRSTTPSTAPVMSAGRLSAELSPLYSTLSRCLAFGSCFWLSLVGVNSDPEVWVQIWIQTYCRKPYTALSSKH